MQTNKNFINGWRSDYWKLQNNLSIIVTIYIFLVFLEGNVEAVIYDIIKWCILSYLSFLGVSGSPNHVCSFVGFLYLKLTIKVGC